MTGALLVLLLAAPVSALTAEEAAVREDLALILSAAGLRPDAVAFARAAPRSPGRAEVEFACAGPTVRLVVRAPDEEWGPAFYHGLKALGFLFPHPRRQVSPPAAALRRRCGTRVAWRPLLARRGFHLHTQHPSEWVAGFLQGRGTIAEDFARWSARNRQNLLQVKALRTTDPAVMAAPFALARRLGVSAGLEVSLCSLQQKSYRLLGGVWPVLGLLRPEAAARRVAASVERLADALPLDFISLELGSTEFTPMPRGVTLAWLEAARAAASARGLAVFTKVHVSSGQDDPRVGNYNFLAADADPGVGVQVHTVMPFGLDGPAPVYGRADFSDLKAFMLREKGRRRTWYYPETSYFVGVDIDAPLLLTDYLLARERDARLLRAEGIEGQVDFTTGQELGYWLFDWTVALLADADERGGALAGLLALGEDPAEWRRHLAYQSRFFVGEGLLGALTASNLMDELPLLRPEHRVLKRTLLRELARDPAALAAETAALERAAAALPPVEGVRDADLRAMLSVTYARVRHALALRRALAHPLGSPERAAFVAEAAAERARALPLVRGVAERTRYPEARLFERRPDPTSYDYGYGYPAATLFFWEREELIVAEGRVNPFFRQLYDPLAILF
ncbi:MAG: hypothetical protein SF051_16695 [Elusimicrobiota bacterium]|nr:hypothetical protein [Elusimicrobiota bacterium]